MDRAFTLDRALRATGDLLARRRQAAAIIVVGGTAVNLLGVVERATRDVDVIAVATPRARGRPTAIRPPEPLAPELADAVATVARDLGLPQDWLNTTVGAQWKTGLPPGLAERVEWRRQGGLWIGVAGRRDLVFLKLYAAADDAAPTSRHFKDLLALKPTAEELTAAQAWLRTQDPSQAMVDLVERVIAHVQTAGR